MTALSSFSQALAGGWAMVVAGGAMSRAARARGFRARMVFLSWGTFAGVRATRLAACRLRGEGKPNRLGVPQPRRAVRAPGEDAFAVGAEAHAHDPARVALEGGLLQSRL